MASIQPNYEINVSKKGNEGRWYHYCRIELGYRLRDEAVNRLEELRKIFGDEYKLELCYWDCQGRIIEA